MKGLELARKYYQDVGQPMLKSSFGQYYHRISVGLVGEGSECFGFDDEISRDHDWGPSFSILLTKEDYDAIGSELQRSYDALPGEFCSFSARVSTMYSGKRVGVDSIGGFYRRYIGLEQAPCSLAQWRIIPEQYLATANNGEIFTDPLGEFTAIRLELLAFYPEDLRIKKLVARAAVMAQSGQYNYLRCMRRQEYVAAQLAMNEFIRSEISMVYLMNKRYTPFYKWMHRGLRSLPVLSETYELFDKLCSPFSAVSESIQDCFEDKIGHVEEICRLVIAELRRQGLTDVEGDNFLQSHCPSMMNRIHDSQLRQMHFMRE